MGTEENIIEFTLSNPPRDPSGDGIVILVEDENFSTMISLRKFRTFSMIPSGPAFGLAFSVWVIPPVKQVRFGYPSANPYSKGVIVQPFQNANALA
jgi:hypothetical protein